MGNKNPVEDFIERNLEEAMPYAGIKANELYKRYCEFAIIYGKCKCTNTRFGIEASKFLRKEKKNDGYYYMGVQFKRRPRQMTINDRIYGEIHEYYNGDFNLMRQWINEMLEKINTKEEEENKYKHDRLILGIWEEGK